MKKTYLMLWMWSVWAALLPAKSDWSWTRELNVATGWDSNVYMAGRGTLANKGDWTQSVGVTIGAERKWTDGGWKLTWKPTGNFFRTETGENNLNQQLASELKWTEAGWEGNWKAGLTAVTGAHETPLYDNGEGGTYTPGLTAPAAMARRDQLNWTQNVKLTKKMEKWLWEVVGEGVYNDWRTRQGSTPTGYQNLADRYNVNAGANVGYLMWEDIYLMAGWRTGYQWQGLRPGSNLRYSNAYNRYLVGLRGKAGEKWSWDVMVGPDVRVFDDVVASGFDTTQSFWTYRATVSWKPTKKDEWTLAASRNIQLSATSGSLYEDIVTNWRWAHSWTKEVKTELGMDVTQRPYVAGASGRSETYWDPVAALSWSPAGKVSWRLTVSTESVQSDEAANVARPADQEWRRVVVGLEAKMKF